MTPKETFPIYRSKMRCIELVENANYGVFGQALYINKKAINDFLTSLTFPQYHLDFETFNSPIPLFNNSKPYQQIPSQFSLHIWHSFDSLPQHHSFLADGTGDPRPAFMKNLKNLLDSSGSIVVYNKSFEISRLKECACILPQYKKWLDNNILPRIIDLLIPFKNFWYYNPKQCGSASIKKVLPAVCGKSYDGMAIANGKTASSEFMRVHFSKTSRQEKKEVRKNLIEYCKLDTQTMIDIVNELTHFQRLITKYRLQGLKDADVLLCYYTSSLL